MSKTKSSVIASSKTDYTSSRWRTSDTMWVLSLYGTAIGAGVLFLPINAGVGGILPLIIITIIAFPMTFFSHRGLCRFVLSGKNQGENITDVVEEHFGSRLGKFITLLYFFAIYPILLVYGVAITNTVDSFIVHQMGFPSPPRAILSLLLISGIIGIVCFREGFILKAMSILVLPFIATLILFAIYLIPKWSGEIFKNTVIPENVSSILMTLWFALPVMVFSFNHSPIISAFAVAKRIEFGNYAEKKCSHILACSHIIMVLTVMFFVFSCILSLAPSELMEAKLQNITILSYLANRFNTPIIAYLAPVIAFIAISTSFFGHYLGVRESLNSIILKSLCRKWKSINSDKLNRITAFFMLLTCWVMATLNPSILGMIENLGGPIIAIILFIMPMYAIHKVPSMNKYSGHVSNSFVIIIGLTAISAILYSLWTVIVSFYGNYLIN